MAPAGRGEDPEVDGADEDPEEQEDDEDEGGVEGFVSEGIAESPIRGVAVGEFAGALGGGFECREGFLDLEISAVPGAKFDVAEGAILEGKGFLRGGFWGDAG